MPSSALKKKIDEMSHVRYTHNRMLSSSSMSFFFFCILPPLRSTLFLYTTLFRSGLLTNSEARLMQRGAPSRSLVQDTTSRRGHPRMKNLQPAKVLLVAAVIDRKSTRLNSSHANISYAVFCFKKKNR